MRGERERERDRERERGRERERERESDRQTADLLFIFSFSVVVLLHAYSLARFQRFKMRVRSFVELTTKWDLYIVEARVQLLSLYRDFWCLTKSFPVFYPAFLLTAFRLSFFQSSKTHQRLVADTFQSITLASTAILVNTWRKASRSPSH